MKQIDKSDSQIELEKLCNTVRTLIEHKSSKM